MHGHLSGQVVQLSCWLSGDLSGQAVQLSGQAQLAIGGW